MGGNGRGIGRLEGEFAKGAGRRPGGAERRRNGRSPFARRDGGRPAAGCCGFCRVGEERGVGRSPFRRSRKPQAEPAETARRAVGLRRDAGLLLFRRGGGRPVARMPAAFAGWGRSAPQMVRGGRKDCTCGRFFGIIGDGSTERRWRMCRL